MLNRIFIKRSVIFASLGIAAFSANAGLAQQASNSPVALMKEAPAGAPNIVLVLLDDVGFGAASTFGGAADTPALEELAAQGLRYNRFHTTAICSPTRASLLTGQNPHATGIGSVQNSADARPGYTGFHNAETASIAEILRENGYSTAAFGKWHQTPDWELSQAGPFDRWPTGEGFEKFYGFLGGETDQFEPSLFEGTTPVVRPAGDDYHLTEDLADKAQLWLHQQHSLAPNKPFFLYFSTGGIHAPIQVGQQWIDQYKGQFDAGWDVMREEVLARQIALGVVPADTQLTPRPESMPAWDTLSADEKRIAARFMEAYAGFLSHTDAQVGRLVQTLKDSGQFENTIFIYIVGDNGASAEGGLTGSLNYMGRLQGFPEDEADKLAKIDDIGGPRTYAHVNAGWAWGTDAPFQWTKTVASHLGGTRNGMVISWPEHIQQVGELRSQFGHVNDIAPTLLEAAGISAPEYVHGVKQRPMDGTSLIYSFADADAPERHTTQYFEVFGHRAIYDRGWMASAFHNRVPWGAGIGQGDVPFDQDVWELYDLRTDFSQAHDLAQTYPEKLAELQQLFMTEAARNQVLPLSGQVAGKAGLPSLAAGRDSATFYTGTVAVPEQALPQMLNRSWSVIAEVNVADAAQGVIATIGGYSAGWSLYIDEERRPVFTYRSYDLTAKTLTGTQPLPAGPASLRVNFDYDGGGYARGGTLKLLVNGAEQGEARLNMTPPAMYSINETFDVGIDLGSAAGFYPESAPLGYPFSGGSIDSVTLESR